MRIEFFKSLCLGLSLSISFFYLYKLAAYIKVALFLPFAHLYVEISESMKGVKKVK